MAGFLSHSLPDSNLSVDLVSLLPRIWSNQTVDHKKSNNPLVLWATSAFLSVLFKRQALLPSRPLKHISVEAPRAEGSFLSASRSTEAQTLCADPPPCSHCLAGKWEVLGLVKLAQMKW